MKISETKFLKELARSCLTIAQLAEKSEVHEVTIYRMKNGKNNSQASTIGKIAKALDVPVEALLEEED